MELWGRRRGAPLADAVLVLLLAGAGAYVAWAAATTLRYNWNWSIIPGFLLRWDETGRLVPNILLIGVFNTLRLAIWGMLGAAPIGLAVALMRLARDRFLRLVGGTYVELIRNVPALVLLFILYFFVSAQITPLLGIDRAAATMGPGMRAFVSVVAAPPELLVAFVSGAICLAVFEGAFIAEILRAGILAVERGQWEAGGSLGLSRWQVLRLVVVPQAVAKSLPPLGTQFIALVKESAIVSIVSIQDLTFMANEVAVSTGRVFEVWITTSGLYFLICFVLSLTFARLERRARRGR